MEVDEHTVINGVTSEDGNKHQQCHFPKNELNVSCDICLQL